jgi:hypothetical protein
MYGVNLSFSFAVMRMYVMKGILWVGFSFLLVVFSVGELSATLIDMRDVMHSRYKENQEKGSLKKFPEWTLNGNLYEKAHAMAELQLVHPALQALDLTYNVISDRCSGEEILARDITNVFAKSSAGEQFRMMLDAREMVSTVKDAWFDQSCLAVYACYNKDALTSKWVDLDNLKYSDTVYRSCTSTVDDIFMIMYQRASSLERMKNLNYGDEFLVNGNADDGPYDLLLDIQAIGDILFAHNDGPSEIHFYDMQQVSSYVTNDPDELTPFETINPEEKDRMSRFPVTIWVTPTIPKQVQGVFPPKQWWVSPVNAGWLSSNLVKPFGWWPAAQAVGEHAWGSIANIACEEPLEDIEPQEDILALAEAENEQTKTYNAKLDLDTEVAIILASKMSPEDEQQLGVIPRGWWGDPSDPSPPSPEAEETAKQIFNDLLDMDGVTLEATKKHIQWCVEQFTEGDKGAWSKILFKSITQPAEFTKCVLWNLCREIWDPTWRGMFRIKICRELRKWSGLLSNQSIKSSEEVIDEMLNICTTLKESGALLEHNKTKDHLEDKLMRIKFANKFAFGVSVIFKWPRDAIDPAIAKQRARQQREFLENVQLNITDDLTFVEERNRYLILESWGSRGWTEGDTEIAKANQEQMENNARLADVMYREWVTANTNAVATQLQLDTTAGVIWQIQDFVAQNIEMRKTANQYTDAINKKWATTLRLYQASPH